MQPGKLLYNFHVILLPCVCVWGGGGGGSGQPKKTPKYATATDTCEWVNRRRSLPYPLAACKRRRMGED